MGATSAYIGLDQFGAAVDILEKGFQCVSNNSEDTRLLEDYLHDSLASVADPLIGEIALYCSSEQYMDAFNRMQAKEYTDVIEFFKFLGRPYIVNTNYGKIGIYEVNSNLYGNYMFYYGDYNGHLREGAGTWLSYYNNNNYYAHCEWENDVPNGYATVQEWNSELAGDVVYRIISGKVINGLWNGEVNWNFDESGKIDENIVYFDNGRWIATKREDGDEQSTHPYYSGDISLTDDDLLKSRGIAGYGDE